MPSSKSVADFKANLLRPALTSHYEVEIGVPSALSLAPNDKRTLHLQCSEASLPGSQLATTEINNDYVGVRELHAYRRIFDETIDLTFYVDAAKYLPIKFFESWISYIVGEDDKNALKRKNYSYKVRYPDGNAGYTATGLRITKFEKDYNETQSDGSRIHNQISYEFVKSYPKSISSMPVSYDGASLLKCSVQMTYIRYVVESHGHAANSRPLQSYSSDPFQQATFNSGGLSGIAANLAGAVVGGVLQQVF